MKKEKIVYRYLRYEGPVVSARREISFGIKLSSRLLLDELCYKRNKDMLENAINRSIETGNKEKFLELSNKYKSFVRG